MPLAICPRGYRGSKSHGLTRITAAYPGTADSLHVVERCASLAEQLGIPSILQSWEFASQEALAALKTSGAVAEDVALQVAVGKGWDQALDAAEWDDGDLLAIGTSPQGAIARVFLGSKGTKIVRHSPVPVLPN